MAIKSKSGKKRKLILKASPYDIPEVVLELVSKICLAVDTSDYPMHLGEPLHVIVYGNDEPKAKDDFKELCIYKYFFKNRQLFSNQDFYFDVVRAIRDLAVEIRTANDKSNVRIIVAGSFSAGKSTFINNALVGEPDFLPVSNLPTTSVATSVYFTPRENECRVKAVNLKGVVVTLDDRILQVIRHKQDIRKNKNLSASDFIMSVVKEMYIEAKSERFSGYTFVDTPGFGNSDKANDFNGKSDDQVASEMFQDADFLLWVTDRQLDDKDLEHISLFKGPFAVMLNKVGEKTGETKKLNDITDKIEANYAALHSEKFKGDISQLVDVFAYSYLPDKEEIRYSKNGYMLLDDIIKVAKRNKQSKYQHPHFRQLERLFDNEIRNTKRAIEKKETQLESYSKHVHYLFTQKEKQIDDKEIAELVEYAYLEDSDRFKRMAIFKENLERHVETIKKFKRILLEAIRSGEEKYKEGIKIQDATTPSIKSLTIFEAIDSGDDLLFRKSLDGVDLFCTNKDGYTPLTYAVKSGNNTMVKILLKLGASPDEKDDNGKNAFHVAIECQFRDMCEILISNYNDRNIWEEKTIEGKSVWELAEQNMFYEWLKDFYNKKHIE